MSRYKGSNTWTCSQPIPGTKRNPRPMTFDVSRDGIVGISQGDQRVVFARPQLTAFLQFIGRQTRRWLLVLGLLALATVAAADCTTTTIMHTDGRVEVCTTCCFAGSCAVTCTRS